MADANARANEVVDDSGDEGNVDGVEDELPPVRNRVTVPEAWIHEPRTTEAECTPEQIAFMDEVFYKAFLRAEEPDEDDVERPVLEMLQGASRGKVGYNKFRRYMTEVLAQADPLDITAGNMLWYYNRNTIAQIYFRVQGEAAVGAGEHKSMPLYRSFKPMNEFQLDTFSYQNAARPGGRASFTHVLVGVDPSTRVAFARALGENKVGSVSTSLVAMVPEEIQPMVRLIRTDDGGEFKDLLAHMEAKGWKFPAAQGDVDVRENTAVRTVTELNGLVHQMENKAGAQLSGMRYTSSLLAPVETMVRTVREVIEQWIRAGHSDGTGWRRNLSDMMIAYNNTIHAAFDNQYSPKQVFEDETLQQRYLTKNTQKRAEYRADVQEDGLRAGDYVRIKRREGKFTKQSIPTWSYDVYEVTDAYERNRDFARVPLRRVKQVTRERAGVYNEPAATNVDEPPLVHFSRLAKVKTMEVNGRGGQTIDPPAETRWLGFFRSLDARTYTQRQGKEGDYRLTLGRGSEIPEREVEPARQLGQDTVVAMRRGRRRWLAEAERLRRDPEATAEQLARHYKRPPKRRRRQA